MGNNIYVGNLAFSSTENSISDLFSQHGTVESCRLITDRDTGRSKGFCFVEMSTSEEAADAIATLDGQELDGRALKVNEARPKTQSSGRSSYSSFSENSGDSFSGFARNSRRSAY